MNDSIVRQGRKFHNISESIYWLPNDDEEMDRLIGVSDIKSICFRSFLVINKPIQATFCTESLV